MRPRLVTPGLAAARPVSPMSAGDPRFSCSDSPHPDFDSVGASPVTRGAPAVSTDANGAAGPPLSCRSRVFLHLCGGLRVLRDTSVPGGPRPRSPDRGLDWHLLGWTYLGVGVDRVWGRRESTPKSAGRTSFYRFLHKGGDDENRCL